MTPAQVAVRLRVTEHTVYDWLRKGRLRGVKLGRLWRIASEDLKIFVCSDRSDFTEPLTAEEAIDSETAWRAYLDGSDPSEPLSEVRRSLLGEQCA